MTTIKAIKKIYSLMAILILQVVLLCAFSFVGCSGTYNPPMSNVPYTVAYDVSDGGKIEGKIIQYINYGADTEEVTAVPYEGFYFVKWSDGVATATRQDKNITDYLNLIAEFSQITDGISVKYKTNYASAFLMSVGDGLPMKELEQTVQRGTDGWRVETRLANGELNGVEFLQWSDGIKSTWRQDKDVTESFEVIAIYGFPVQYGVSGEGSIEGEFQQKVAYAEHGQTVTAHPNKGYRFVQWSDGVKTATRQDKWVVNPIDVCAIFEWRDTDEFAYHYNYATGNYNEDSLRLTRGEVDGVNAIAPERNFFTFDGWYLDEKFAQKAIDSNGKNLLGEDIFNSPSRDLFAKWNVKKEYVVTYKILMVYVTAIDGKFVGNDGKNLDVHYQMTEPDKQQCMELTKSFEDTLNDMLDGLVNFEVDIFFTTTTLDESSFNNEKESIYVFANEIPELKDSNILDDYRSVLTVYSFGVEENLFPSWSGLGGKKYAAIPMDMDIKRLGSLAQVVAASYDDGLVETCVHEFIHTIEQGIACYEFHQSVVPCVPPFVTSKLYLLNQYPVEISSKLADYPELWKEEHIVEAWRNSDKAGVPYGYWANEIFDVIIKPECINGRPDGYGGVGTVDTGGYVNFYNNKSTERDYWRMFDSGIVNGQRVPKGSRTTMFFVEAKKGYKFIGWSDGVEDELRILTDVQENITLIAYFERLSYTVEYIAGEGGRIEGETVQTLLTGERTKWVKAVADEGYRFVGWSDNSGYHGATNDERSDIIGTNEYDENGELYFRLGFSVTAIFEKIETS